MSCAGCSKNGNNGLPKGCRNNGACASGGCTMLEVFDWLAGMDLPSEYKSFDCVEVRFKNTRKEYYRNSNNLQNKVKSLLQK